MHSLEHNIRAIAPYTPFLVGVAVVPPTGDALIDLILSLPSDAVTQMPANLGFACHGWRQIATELCEIPPLLHDGAAVAAKRGGLAGAGGVRSGSTMVEAAGAPAVVPAVRPLLERARARLTAQRNRHT